jgi:transcriptional regulator with XRE-family HTH domain
MDNEEWEFRSLLSRNIKRFRARLGLSQLSLALELNISPTFLSDIETGKKWASPTMLVRISKALGIKTHELFSIEETEQGDFDSNVLQKCLDDVQLSVKLSVKQSVEKSIEGSIAAIKEYYLVKKALRDNPKS